MVSWIAFLQNLEEQGLYVVDGAAGVKYNGSLDCYSPKPWRTGAVYR